MTQAEARAKIAAVQALMSSEEIDALELDNDATFKKLAEGVLAWNELLKASKILRRDTKSKEIAASAFVMQAVLFNYAYALGIQRGERGRALRGKKRK